MKKIKLFSLVILFFATFFGLNACRKLIEIDPPVDRIVGPSIYKDPASATKVLTGIYYRMSSPASMYTGGGSLSVKLSYAADDLIEGEGLDHFYNNALSPDQDTFYWQELYSYIFSVNAAIEGINGSEAINSNLKTQLIAEARFIRAFNYFYLVNLYGDVPLLLTTDYAQNALLPRTSADKVYQQILTDLTEAKAGLSENYLAGDAIAISGERTRPNKAAATALLARVYLYVKDWQKAESEATVLIGQTDKYKLEPIEQNFLFASKEAIWQLEPVNIPRVTEDASHFLLGDPTGLSWYLRPGLILAAVDGDLRKNFYMKSYAGTDLYCPYKYKALAENPGEYLMVFRLAEQYLIRAEARVQQGRATGDNSAQNDLDAVRQRAGLPGVTSSTPAAILEEIANERRLEFFTEWGHRWFDLKRTGQINAVMKAAKGNNWQSADQLLPIPNNDLKKDKNLVQNPGY